MIYFSYNTEMYRLRFAYGTEATQNHGVIPETWAILEGKTGDEWVVIQRDSVRHYSTDAPNFRVARKAALAKLLTRGRYVLPFSGKPFRTAVWNAYWSRTRPRKLSKAERMLGAEQDARMAQWAETLRYKTALFHACGWLYGNGIQHPLEGQATPDVWAELMLQRADIADDPIKKIVANGVGDFTVPPLDENPYWQRFLKRNPHVQG